MNTLYFKITDEESFDRALSYFLYKGGRPANDSHVMASLALEDGALCMDTEADRDGDMLIYCHPLKDLPNGAKLLTHSKKPPLGIQPYRTYENTRIREIVGGMGRYLDAGEDIPLEWCSELYCRVQNAIKEHKSK